MCTAMKLHCFMWLIIKIFLKKQMWWKITDYNFNNGLTEGLKGNRSFVFCLERRPLTLGSSPNILSKGPRPKALKENTGTKTTHTFCQKVQRTHFPALKQWFHFAKRWTKPRSSKGFNCWLAGRYCIWGISDAYADSPPYKRWHEHQNQTFITSL